MFYYLLTTIYVLSCLVLLLVILLQQGKGGDSLAVQRLNQRGVRHVVAERLEPELMRRELDAWRA